MMRDPADHHAQAERPRWSPALLGAIAAALAVAFAAAAYAPQGREAVCRGVTVLPECAEALRR